MGFFDGIVNSVTNAVSDIGLKDIVAPLIGGATGLIGGSQANQANWDIAQANNNWSAQQFANRYQTTVDDLKKAGLNPMLAYSQGGGSPPSAQAVPARSNLGADLLTGISSASQSKNNMMQNYLIKAQVNKTDEEADNIAADTVNKRDINPKIKQELNNLIAENEYIRMRARQTRAAAMDIENLLPKSKQEGKYYDTYGIHPFELRDLATGVNSASNAINSINPFKRGSRTTTITNPSYQKNYYSGE